jgi:uncharacterized membrane protein
MSEEKEREYWVPFKGCRPLNKRQANMVGFTLICGFLAAAIAVPTLGKGILSGSLVLAVTIVGYFLGKKLFES